MGPLAGIRVVELAGLGPAPFCGMVLADLGAEVIRVDRATDVVGGHSHSTRYDILNRGKRSIGVNLKAREGKGVVLDLVAESEVLIEGFRPGVTERLGVGPAECLARNPRLVYGRMTGWGQEGPLASQAGHDIDYIAISGVLGAVGPTDRPIPPINLVGDFGGGAMLLAVGVLAAVIEARASGRGQVVDAAMTDGSALLLAMEWSFKAQEVRREGRESNLLDGGAPFYSVYETADGGFMAVGALEPQFFAALLEGLEIDPTDLPAQSDRDGWEEMRGRFQAVFNTRTRAEWEDRFSGADACVAPVLGFDEAPTHEHNVHRRTYVAPEGLVQPAPAPRFSATPTAEPRPPSSPGDTTDEVLSALGYEPSRIGMLRSIGAIA